MNNERGQSISVDEAKKILRRIKSNYTKRHSHMHDEAAHKISFQLQALEGLCGDCVNINPEVYHYNSGQSLERVALRCQAGLSPLKLYQDKPFTQKAQCPGFVAIKDTKSS